MMRSIVSIRGISSLGSGRRPPPFSSTRGSAAAMAEAAHDGPQRSPMFGTIDDAPAGWEKNPEAIKLARFAVAEHNTKANAALEFERLVKVRGQLVSGTMNYLTTEVKEVGGAKKLYQAKVWNNFRGLQEFKSAD